MSEEKNFNDAVGSYRVIKSLYIPRNSVWYFEGAEFPPKGLVVSDEEMRMWVERRYIDTPENIARASNPEAAQASDEAASLGAELQAARERIQQLAEQVKSMQQAEQAGAGDLELLAKVRHAAKAGGGGALANIRNLLSDDGS